MTAEPVQEEPETLGGVPRILFKATVKRSDILKPAGKRYVDDLCPGVLDHMGGVFDPHGIQVGEEIDPYHIGKQL